MGLDRCTGQCDPRGAVETQGRAKQVAFERRFAAAIADQGVGKPPGRDVHGAGAADTDRGMARTATVLKRAEQARLEHGHAHASCSASRCCNSSSSMMRK